MTDAKTANTNEVLELGFYWAMDGNTFTPNKKKFVDAIMGKISGIFEKALDKYHSYAIELPMTVDTVAGAKVPTYAHDTDAAADLYAPINQIIPAHS